jgi:hypothetical protein
MASISSPGIIRSAMTALVALAAIACLGLGLRAWATWNGTATQAALEQLRSNEIAEEGTAICQKWGMPAGTTKHAECIADLKSVRQRHEERITQDMGLL